MNTFMYDHPLTKPQLEILRTTLGYHVVGPIGKLLACGDMGERNASPTTEGLADNDHAGVGAMTEWTDIVKLVVDKYELVKT